jgi:hypothetical protein
LAVDYVFALPTESLPTYHWAYQVIEELQLRGVLREINLSERPITRGQVAYAVISARGDERSIDQWLLDLLRKEFAIEIRELESSSSNAVKEAIEGILSPTGGEESTTFQGDAGIRLQGDWEIRQDSASQVNGIAIAQLGVQFRRNVAAQTRLRLDSHLPDDSTYEGKVWRGLAGYAEAGYIRYEGRIFDAIFGRDHFTIGSGKTTHLLLADYSLPLDVIWVAAGTKNVRYSFLTAQLDTMRDSPAQSEVFRRFLAIHRLWLKLHSNLSIGLSEAVLYGGPNRTFELQFLNPFLYWHGEVLNRAGTGNIFVMLDLDWFPWAGSEFYGEFLIDDLQIEKRIPKDLEPSEVGWILGSRFTNLPVIPRAVVTIEYTGITNRTYNSMTPYEKYLHLGRPLGSEFGNDFDRWMLSLSQWIRKDLECNLTATYFRKGEGSITAPFDTTYLEYTVKKGYDEPFPTGIVQKETTISVGAFFIPTRVTWLQFEAGMTWVSNEDHIAGVDNRYAWTNLSLILEIDDLLRYRY